MRRPRWFAIVLLTFGATGGTAFGAGSPIEISLRIGKHPTSQAQTVRVFGTVEGAAAGEHVDVLVKDCRSDHFRVVGGTQTTPGGRFDANVYLEMRGAFVARWRGRTSRPLVAVPKLTVGTVQTPRTRIWKVSVSAYGTGVRFDGREVELQRLSPTGWVRVRRAKLRREEFASYAAVFTIPTRNLTLRFLAPDKTARPCFRAGVSEIFRS